MLSKFAIDENYFIHIPLEDHLILSDGAERILILSPEGKFIFQEYLNGKSVEEISRDIEKETGLPPEETESFVSSLLSSIEAQALTSSMEEGIHEVPPAPLPEAVTYITKGYEIHGKRCTIHYGNTDTHTILHPLIAHAEAGFPPETADLTFHLIAAGDSYAFYRDGEEIVRDKSLVYVKNVALFEIFDALHPDRSWLAVFHGAVVKTKDRAVILSGLSGKGKSTLTAYLVQEGFTFLSDDLAILEAGNVGIMPTPYAISLKEDTWNVLSEDLPKLAAMKSYNIYGESLKFFAPANGKTGNRPPDPVKKALLFFIGYEKGAGIRMEPLTPVDALRKIIGIGAWISHREDHLRQLMEWLKITPAYNLTYPDLKSAGMKIREIVSLNIENHNTFLEGEENGKLHA